MPSTRFVGARELKIRLGGYLARVRKGELIVVTDRRQPVAELRPLPPARQPLDAVLSRLEAEGRLQQPRARLRPFVPLVAKRGRSVADAIVEDREDRC